MAGSHLAGLQGDPRKSTADGQAVRQPGKGIRSAGTDRALQERIRVRGARAQGPGGVAGEDARVRLPVSSPMSPRASASITPTSSSWIGPTPSPPTWFGSEGRAWTWGPRFEMGYMRGLGKPAFAYYDARPFYGRDEAPGRFVDRVRDHYCVCAQDPRVDGDGQSVEGIRDGRQPDDDRRAFVGRRPDFGGFR